MRLETDRNSFVDDIATINMFTHAFMAFMVLTAAVLKYVHMIAICIWFNIYFVYRVLLPPFLTSAVDSTAFNCTEIGITSKVVRVVKFVTRVSLANRSFVVCHFQCAFEASSAVFERVHICSSQHLLVIVRFTKVFYILGVVQHCFTNILRDVRVVGGIKHVQDVHHRIPLLG